MYRNIKAEAKYPTPRDAQIRWSAARGGSGRARGEEKKAAEEAKSPAPTGDKPGEVAARVASEKGEAAPVCSGCVIL